MPTKTTIPISSEAEVAQNGMPDAVPYFLRHVPLPDGARANAHLEAGDELQYDVEDDDNCIITGYDARPFQLESRATPSIQYYYHCEAFPDFAFSGPTAFANAHVKCKECNKFVPNKEKHDMEVHFVSDNDDHLIESDDEIAAKAEKAKKAKRREAEYRRKTKEDWDEKRDAPSGSAPRLAWETEQNKKLAQSRKGAEKKKAATLEKKRVKRARLMGEIFSDEEKVEGSDSEESEYVASDSE